jgi:hypothetical protein
MADAARRFGFAGSNELPARSGCVSQRRRRARRSGPGRPGGGRLLEHDRVELRARAVDGWREPLELTVPGETSLEQTLTLDRGRCPGGANYELFGEAQGGYAVGGLWSYRLRPTAREPDAERARARARRVLTQQSGS